MLAVAPGGGAFAPHIRSYVWREALRDVRRRDMTPKKPGTSSTALVKPATAAVDKFSEGFRTYIAGLGLPVEGVLVVPAERSRVLSNVPELIELIDPIHRAEAMYVSKFIAACGAGLFDAALNFIWDEVVVRLRARVVRFDLAYFFDTAVPAPERQDYQNEEDLRALSDASLIRGALKCGMLTDVGYRHLDYIREMRNWASAAHPNHAELTGFQLVSWFETCLKEVILREPEGAVLEVGRLLRNLREQTIQAADIPAIGASIKRLPSALAAALLRSTVGLFCDPRQEVRVRDNIKNVARALWVAAPDSARGEIGLKHANYAANGDVDRKRLAHQFLELVDGLVYLTESDLALEIQTRLLQLEDVHDGWDNFHNEPPVVRQLRKYVPPTGKIPSQVNEEYVRILVRCRLGRDAGVSRSAVPIYDELVALFDEPQFDAFVGLLDSPDITLRLRDSVRVQRFKDIATKLRAKAVGQGHRRVFDAILSATVAQMSKLWHDAKFKGLVAQM